MRKEEEEERVLEIKRQEWRRCRGREQIWEKTVGHEDAGQVAGRLPCVQKHRKRVISKSKVISGWVHFGRLPDGSPEAWSSRLAWPIW